MPAPDIPLQLATGDAVRYQAERLGDGAAHQIRIY
jgi:hypothetical protein